MIGFIIGVAVVVGVLLFLRLARRGAIPGAVLLSHLKCPNCGSEFDYAYVPGASFTSLRLWGSREIRCPVCHKWSLFNLTDTRVDQQTHHCDLRVGPS